MDTHHLPRIPFQQKIRTPSILRIEETLPWSLPCPGRSAAQPTACLASRPTTTVPEARNGTGVVAIADRKQKTCGTRKSPSPCNLLRLVAKISCHRLKPGRTFELRARPVQLD